MLKLDVSLWLTVKRYSEVSTRMSDKRKYKKDSFTDKKRKAWNRGKRTQMPVTVTEGLAAADMG